MRRCRRPDSRRRCRRNGANVAENIDISANGGRALFFRDVANVTMDLNDTEVINFNALGGADTIVVNDLSGTDVSEVNINLAAAGGGGDGAADTIIINATQGEKFWPAQPKVLIELLKVVDGAICLIVTVVRSQQMEDIVFTRAEADIELFPVGSALVQPKQEIAADDVVVVLGTIVGLIGHERRLTKTPTPRVLSMKSTAPRARPHFRWQSGHGSSGPRLAGQSCADAIGSAGRRTMTSASPAIPSDPPRASNQRRRARQIHATTVRHNIVRERAADAVRTPCPGHLCQRAGAVGTFVPARQRISRPEDSQPIARWRRNGLH